MEILKEVAKNITVAINAIDDIIGNVKDNELKNCILHEKEGLLGLNRDVFDILQKTPSQNDGTAPNAFEKSMMSMGIKMKSGVDKSNTNIVEMLIEGYNMGINDIIRVSHEGRIEPHPLVGEMIEYYDKCIKELRQYL